MKMRMFLGAIALSFTSGAACADTIVIADAYARAASPSAKAGAAFMEIMNHADSDDRLIEARSDIAQRTELHRHIDAGNGVMQMREIEGGMVIPAGDMHLLARGGDHVMFMGLNESLSHGDMVFVTFVFENAGEITVEIPVDLER